MLFFDAEYFEPEATIESGQMFRYKRLEKNDYILYSMDKACRVTRLGDKVSLDTDSEDYFSNYFDLSTDYRTINNKLQEFPEIREAARRGKGIRMLKQNLLECIISFIISANNNIPRIKLIIQRLTEKYGQPQNGFYSFPTLERLVSITKEEFRALGAGFRDTYLASTINTLATTDILDRLTAGDDETAYKMLCSLKGVGAKVADCIMLFGLARYRRFPVDVWMFRACKTDKLDSPQKINAFYASRYGEYAGIAQQYIFYKARQTAKN